MSENNLKRRLTPMDSFFLYVDREEQPMNVGSVCMLEGKVSYRKILRHMRDRIHLVPRYRQRVIPAPGNVGHPTWEDDPDFDVRNHVFHLKIEAPGTEEQLSELASAIFTGMLDRDKPLWELYCVQGLEDDRSALILKVHHCMVDGVAGISLAFLFFDVAPDEAPKVKPPPYRPEPLPDRKTLLYSALWDNTVDGMVHWLRFQAKLKEVQRRLDGQGVTRALRSFGGTLGNFLMPLKRMPFNGTMSGERLFRWQSFSFADARAIRAVCGGSLNDVVMTALANGLRNYLRDHDPKRTHTSFRVLVPVNVRLEREKSALGNRISFLPVDLPLDIEDPVDLLQAVSVHMRELKEFHVAQLVSLMFDVLQGSPAFVQSWALSAAAQPLLQAALGQVIQVPPGNMLCTNVPGPQIPLYCLGHRVLTMYPLVPACLEMGVNFGIVSYDQKLMVAVTADGKSGYDADLVLEYFAKSFEELREAAQVKSDKYIRLTRTAERQPEPVAP